MLSARAFPTAVCFDLYGTLVDIRIDTESAHVWENLSAELESSGVRLSPEELHARYDRLVEAERREHGQPFVLDNLFFFKLLANGHTLHPHTVHHFGRRFRALTTRQLSVKPYAPAVLDTLRQSGCRLAIVSNTEETVTSHDLDELRLRNYFDAIVLSSSVGVKKPEARIFHIALRRLGAKPADSVFIGDDYECDYRGSQKAGLRSVLLCEDCRHASAECVRPDTRAVLGAIAERHSA